MKKSKIQFYLILCIIFGMLMATAFRLVTPIFVTFKSPSLNIIFTIMCFFAGLMVGYSSFLIGKITLLSTIKKINKFTTELSKGNLTCKIHIDSNDEIGEISTALTKVSANLRSVINNILTNVEDITNTSINVSKDAQSLYESTTHQTQATENMTLTINEVLDIIQVDNGITKTSEKISLKMQKEIELMNYSAEKSISTIKEIAEKSLIINDISMKTNILSLNAAVESARVGESGKGFSVIASEVQKLAVTSRSAADEIKVISDNSLKITEDLKKMTNNLITGAEQTSSSVKRMNESNIKQNNQIENIGNFINQVEKLTTKNIYDSNNLAKSADELILKSKELKEQINFFKI